MDTLGANESKSCATVDPLPVYLTQSSFLLRNPPHGGKQTYMLRKNVFRTSSKGSAIERTKSALLETYLEFISASFECGAPGGVPHISPWP